MKKDSYKCHICQVTFAMTNSVKYRGDGATLGNDAIQKMNSSHRGGKE